MDSNNEKDTGKAKDSKWLGTFLGFTLCQILLNAAYHYFKFPWYSDISSAGFAMMVVAYCLINFVVILMACWKLGTKYIAVFVAIFMIGALCIIPFGPKQISVNAAENQNLQH